jgi:hypothetical protein
MVVVVGLSMGCVACVVLWAAYCGIRITIACFLDLACHSGIQPNDPALKRFDRAIHTKLPFLTATLNQRERTAARTPHHESEMTRVSPDPLFVRHPCPLPVLSTTSTAAMARRCPHWCDEVPS